jgi:hypothetical protein
MSVRSRCRIAAFTFAAWSAPGAAVAGPAVTIYSGDLAYVRETRGYEVARGRDTLRLGGLPDRVDVTSIRFAPSGGARMTGLAWRADLASGDRALELAIGQRVSVRQKDERWLKGVLVSADGSFLLLRAADGFTHAVSRGAAEEIVFEQAPALGSAKPVLEVALDGARAGKGEGQLAYLTGGFDWSAEHTLIRGKPGTGEWAASVTVTNHSGVSFEDATLKLVAGNPSRGAAPPPRPVMMKVAMESANAADGLVEESFSEYHLYTLPRPATLRDREAQQLTMLDPRPVKLDPRYLVQSGGPVMAQLEIVNSKASGPGAPLPAGRVRIFEPDASGALQFTGESRIGHTPLDEKLTLDIGTAFDLVAERRDVENRRISDREREYDVEVKLRNRKKESVTIVVEEPMRGDYDVLRRSHPFTVKDARTIRFDVAVPAGQEVTVTYTARVRY